MCRRARALGFSFLLALSVGTGCARWVPARPYQVTAQESARAYDTVLRVLRDEKYTIVDRSDARRRVRVRARSDVQGDNPASFISIEVEASRVKLAPSGSLVRADGKIHRKLRSELGGLEATIKKQLARAEPAAPVARSQPRSQPGDAADPSRSEGKAPPAWSEPAYDPKTWGPGNFTCIPAELPSDQRGALALRLSNGELADVALSVAYAPELCRSPSACKLPKGCPALGLGDADQVNRLARRIHGREIDARAVLVKNGKPVATIDLSRHGSIAQAMSQIDEQPR
jgi:hypothetical protein